MKNENTRPEWFVCAECLFWDEGSCHHADGYGTGKKWFCSNWTCPRCFQEWNAWEYDNKQDEPIYVDHTKCKPAVFK